MDRLSQMTEGRIRARQSAERHANDLHRRPAGKVWSSRRLVSGWVAVSSICIGITSTADAETTYSAAVKSEQPHVCEFSVPSFFGEQSKYRVEIQGDDFAAKEIDSFMNVARVGGWGAMWAERSEVGEVRKLDLRRAEAAYQKLYRWPMNRWEYALVFVEPGPDAPCSPVEEVTIPPLPLISVDFTDEFIEVMDREFRESVEIIESVPFPLLLPNPPLQGYALVRGHGSRHGYGLEYVSRDGSEHAQMRISLAAAEALEERDHVIEEMKVRGGGTLKMKRKTWRRELLLTTPDGHQVFSEIRNEGSSSRNPHAIRHYLVNVGETGVHVSYPHWRVETNRDAEWWSHDFAPGELERLIDSLKPATAEDIIRFPRMTAQ